MSLPKVTILFSTDNLLPDIDAVDGIMGICATVSDVGLINVPKQVFSLADAVSQGFTLADEPFMYRAIKEFYSELVGNQELWVMGTADTQTMAQTLDHTDEESALKLVKAAEGKIRVLGILRTPDGGYDAGNEFFDTDVEAAVLAAKNFAVAQAAPARYLRILIEGRINDEDSLDIYSPEDSSNGYAGVVMGGTVADGSASVGLALGRLSKYAAHIKIGKVKNGPLSVPTIYVGTKEIKDLPALESLHDRGIISFMKHPQKAGFYFGIDHMASNDDFRILVHGRVIDKAALIAHATYIEELESEVDTNEDGSMKEVDVKHLEGVIKQNINSFMGDQISGVTVYIDPNQDIVNTSTTAVKLRIRPKGYNTFITVDLGLTATV